MFIGVAIFGATSDKRIKKATAKAAGGVVPPEIRLEGLVPAALCIPIGLIWYGWSAEKKIHWIMPIIGTGWVGLGLIGIFVSLDPCFTIRSWPRQPQLIVLYLACCSDIPRRLLYALCRIRWCSQHCIAIPSRCSSAFGGTAFVQLARFGLGQLAAWFHCFSHGSPSARVY